MNENALLSGMEVAKNRVILTEEEFQTYLMTNIRRIPTRNE